MNGQYFKTAQEPGTELVAMAIIDVVKCEMKDYEFCKKFPSEDLRTSSQLVVYPSQTAIFVKGGQICDTFSAGTYSLKTENIPILNKIINLPFGGDSPFQAEVWFINHTSKLNMKWGTTSPIQLEDPKYNIIVPVRAYGQYGIRVVEATLFLTTLIGNMTDFSAYKVAEYFKGLMLSSLNASISKKIIQDQISILDINQHLIDMSSFCKNEVDVYFGKYGIQLSEFAFISINIPTDDPSVIKLKEAKDMAARMKIMGRDVYQMERSFNVLEKAAGNEGAGGAMMAMGAGIGAGVGVGQNFGQMASNTMGGIQNCPPPLPQEVTYFVYVKGQQLGGQTVQDITSMLIQGSINGDTLAWHAGMAKWDKISNIPELASILGTIPPPIPPQM